MKKLTLTTLTLLVFFCVPCAAATPAVDDATGGVPFTFEKGLVIVQAKIKREGLPVEVILATGSEYSLVNSDLTNKYKLPSFFTVTGINNTETYSYTSVSDVRVGNAEPRSLEMRYGSVEDVGKSIGREIFAILGADFFRGRVVQFDFGKKVVRFLPQSSTGTPADQTTLSGATDRVMLRMLYYKEEVTLPVIENATFDGKKIKTLIDTGAATVVSLSPSATKQLGFASPPDKGKPRADKVGSLRFDSHELTGVPVLLHAKGTTFDRAAREFGAVAGTGLLQNFVITFDFIRKVVILEHM